MSCSIVIEMILSTMSFKHKSVLPWPITLTTLELSVRSVPNDVQKGFKTVKNSPHFSQCATGCAMPQLRGEESLCLQFFNSSSWRPNLLLQHHTIWECQK